MSTEVVGGIEMHAVAYTIPSHDEEELHKDGEYGAESVDEGFVVEVAEQL